MAKAVSDAVLDGAFNILNDGTRQVICSAQPTGTGGAAPTVAQINTVLLASTAMTAGTDYTIADGDTSGRKCTVAAKSGVTITNSGTATHVVLDNGTSQLYCTTCTSQALVAAGTVNIPAWKVEIADPT